jgi:hypothetical protein
VLPRTSMNALLQASTTPLDAAAKVGLLMGLRQV